MLVISQPLSTYTWYKVKQKTIVLKNSIWGYSRGDRGMLIASSTRDRYHYALMDAGRGYQRSELISPWNKMKLLLITSNEFDYLENQCVMR